MSAICYQGDQSVASNSSQNLRNDSAENQICTTTYSTTTLYPQGENGDFVNTVDSITSVLTVEMKELQLNELAIKRHEELQQLQQIGEGSDSGVEINAKQSHNSDERRVACGYASSSNGGMDETSAQCLNISCDSSLVSCGSDLFEAPKRGKCVKLPATAVGSSYECCSENGSESSSNAGGGHNRTPVTVRKSNSFKKKVALFESPENVSHEKSTSSRRNIETRSSSQSARVSGIKRTASLPRSAHMAFSLPREQVWEQRSKITQSQIQQNRMTNSAILMRPSANKSSSNPTKPQKPDSLPTALNRTQSMSMQKLVQRTPSLSRARTPGTPSDDGRWPSCSNRGTLNKRGMSATPDLSSLKVRSSNTDGFSKTSNIYGTMPRRRKQKSVEDLNEQSHARGSRSASITRDSRMTSSFVLSAGAAGLRKNLVSSYGDKMPPPATPSVPTTPKAHARRSLQASVTKTRIYHEISVQTALTSQDIEKAFSVGLRHARPIEAAEQSHQHTQSDIRDYELEHLKEQIAQLNQREQQLIEALKRERDEKVSAQKALLQNSERVEGMLELARLAGGDNAGTPTSEDGSHDSLLMLQSQIQISGSELMERQQEIGHLRKYCHRLQLELKRSFSVQESLQQEKTNLEQESGELQDFLQNEKSAMCYALKEMEVEQQNFRQQLMSREEEVKVLRDECRHLVRLNEQRRQENRTLQTKHTALEAKHKDLLSQQTGSVAGASTALAGLHSRLDSLVEQLVASYNISEQDLEDIGFQTDTQPNSLGIGGSSEGCSIDCDNQKSLTNGHDMTLSLQPHSQYSLQQQMMQSNEGSLSPQRNQSFIAAVLSAIRNATTPSGKRMRQTKRTVMTAPNGHNSNNNNGTAMEQVTNGEAEEDSDSTEMLDSETEPCLMMDNVLEDVTLPDSHSHNMVSSCTTGMISQIEIPSDLVNIPSVNGGADDSLNNLSQAIVNRQQMEMQVNALSVQRLNGLQQVGNLPDNSISEDATSCHDSVAEMPSLVDYCTPAQAVLDQIIEVDVLITKLLKVLRLVQMDNDNCIQQLIVDKNKLQQHKEEMLEKMKDIQDVNIKLQDELMDATQELLLKNNDLTSTKTDMQRHRNEIDVRIY